MRALKSCPSCKGAAELIQFPVSGDTLWQVNCLTCGMGTEMNDERVISIQHWNRRDQEERLRSLVTILGVLLPLGMMMMFFIGVFVGSALLGFGGQM